MSERSVFMASRASASYELPAQTANGVWGHSPNGER
ncbi:hypothetical protein BH20ACT4_BH20ACT4_04330 [soil metagenome]